MQSQNSLMFSRAREGETEKALIVQRLDAITEEVVKVRARMPEILEWQRERLLYQI